MKRLIFILLCALTLTACNSCSKMEQPTPNTNGNDSKGIGAFSVLSAYLVDEATPQGHSDCLFTDNGPGKGIFYDKVAGYLQMVGDDCPNVTDTYTPLTDVIITYHIKCTDTPVGLDYVEVTYHAVKHTFWQDCTTSWEGDVVPEWPDQQSPSGNGTQK